MDIVSTKMTNTKAKNVSINCHNKKAIYKIDSNILNTVLLVIILLFIIAIIYYHYTNHESKLTGINGLTI